MNSIQIMGFIIVLSFNKHCYDPENSHYNIKTPTTDYISVIGDSYKR